MHESPAPSEANERLSSCASGPFCRWKPLDGDAAADVAAGLDAAPAVTVRVVVRVTVVVTVLTLPSATAAGVGAELAAGAGAAEPSPVRPPAAPVAAMRATASASVSHVRLVPALLTSGCVVSDGDHRATDQSEAAESTRARRDRPLAVRALTKALREAGLFAGGAGVVRAERGGLRIDRLRRFAVGEGELGAADAIEASGTGSGSGGGSQAGKGEESERRTHRDQRSKDEVAPARRLAASASEGQTRARE